MHMIVRHLFRRPATVTAVEALQLLSEGAMIVDVRRGREWNHHHIPGAIHIPLAELELRAEELPEGCTLITFCTGGLLSSGAANMLVELGFDAVSMTRGLSDWRAAGGPLVAAPG